MKDANGVYSTPPISQYYMLLRSSTGSTATLNNDAGTVQVIVDGIGSTTTSTSVTLSSNKNTYIYGDNITWLAVSNLTLLNVNNNPNLATLNCNSGWLSSLSVSNNKRLGWLNAKNNNLPTSVVDSILAALMANGLSSGSVDLRNNSAPSSRTNIDTLESRGWTVLTDYVDPVLSDSSSSSGGRWKHE